MMGEKFKSMSRVFKYHLQSPKKRIPPKFKTPPQKTQFFLTPKKTKTNQMGGWGAVKGSINFNFETHVSKFFNSYFGLQSKALITIIQAHLIPCFQSIVQDQRLLFLLLKKTPKSSIERSFMSLVGPKTSPTFIILTNDLRAIGRVGGGKRPMTTNCAMITTLGA
jgi:hypothetical protein